MHRVVRSTSCEAFVSALVAHCMGRYTPRQFWIWRDGQRSNCLLLSVARTDRRRSFTERRAVADAIGDARAVADLDVRIMAEVQAGMQGAHVIEKRVREGFEDGAFDL